MTGFSVLENTIGLGMMPLAFTLAAVETGRSDAASPQGYTVKELVSSLPGVVIQGTGARRVTCLITDSRRVVPGALFFAVKGLRSNGNDFVEEAIDRGAVAIVSEEPFAHARPVDYIQVEDARVALAEISRLFYGSPDQSLALTGITGTNGKSTVAMLSQFLLAEESTPVGLLGTIHYDLGKRTLPAYKTTPESVDTYGMLRQMLEQGCQQAVMEVSSHAIVQKRVNGLRLPTVAFLNLTQDHLDYHQTMEAYYAAKRELFVGGTEQLPENAVINVDDVYGRKLLADIPEAVRIITFGQHESATLRAKDISLEASGTRFTLAWPEGDVVVKTQELGNYNVSNVLAALAIAYAQGKDLKQLAQKVESFPGVPGRMERIEEGQSFNVLVDYAHTDDALRNALSMLREVTPGRLLTVFGCGGNRDRQKRKLMTEVSQELSDLVWATSDNPRKESVQTIFEDMKSGVMAESQISFVEDRRRAIGLALAAAEPGDCVLIAGKGHETYQEFADTVVPFDDRQVARELLALQKLK